VLSRHADRALEADANCHLIAALRPAARSHAASFHVRSAETSDALRQEMTAPNAPLSLATSNCQNSKDCERTPPAHRRVLLESCESFAIAPVRASVSTRQPARNPRLPRCPPSLPAAFTPSAAKWATGDQARQAAARWRLFHFNKVFWRRLWLFRASEANS